MMKRRCSRLLALFMCLAMLASFLPAGAASAEALPPEAADAESGEEAAEQTPPTEAIPAETEPPVESEALPVEVEFVCTPEELSLTVWEKAAKESETAETPAAPIEPEENGHYLLLPGVYVYTAACEGYITAEDVEFEIKWNENGILKFTISLLEGRSIGEAIENEPTFFTQYVNRSLTSSEVTERLDSLKATYYEGYVSGIQCYQFARDLAQSIFGSAPGNPCYISEGYDGNGWNMIQNPSASSVILEPGDIIDCRYITGGGGTTGHTAIVWKISDGQIYVAESWGSQNGKVHWGLMECQSGASTLSGILNIYGSKFGAENIYIFKRPDAINGKCTLTFDANGGTCPTTSLEVQSGETLGSRYPTPTRSGYRFLGWFFSKTVSDGVDADTPITRSMTLYAHWVRTQNPGIKISFDANGGTLPGAAMKRIVDAVNTGRGSGWLCVFDFPGEVIETNCWGAEISVNRNGAVGTKRGWGSEDKLIVPDFGFVLSGQKADSDADGCTFVEWAGSYAYIGFNYASWEVSAYETLDAYLTENKYVETGYVYGDLPTPSRDGYVFDGWYTSATGGTEVTYDTYVSVTSPQTLYAHWQGSCEHDYRAEEVPGSCVQTPGWLYICQKCSDIFFLPEESAVSEWSAEKPSGVNDGAIMSRVEYRYRTKETTTGSSNTMPGWTLSGSENVWGEYGAWSGWTRDAVTASESTQVETCALYRYYFYLCDRCGDHNPLSGRCGCGGNSTQWYDIWMPVAYKDSGSSVVSYANAKRQTTSLGDGQLWYFSGGNLNSTETGTKDTDSDSTVIEQGYRYRTRAQSTVYHFYRWSAWSEWSSTPVEATDSTDVETRTLYRYYLAADSYHQWNSGAVTTAASCDTEGIKTYSCTACGKTKTETVAALGHDWEPWTLTSAPTESSDGVETRSCRADSCGKTETRPVTASFVTVSFNVNGGSPSIASQRVLKSGTLPVLPTASRAGYSFDGWYTAASGGEKISTSTAFDSDATVYAHWTKSAPVGRIPGDVTDDGEVNIFDLLRLKKYLADPNSASVNMANADVTGDGEVNIFDLLRLKKHLAGMDVTLV